MGVCRHSALVVVAALFAFAVSAAKAQEAPCGSDAWSTVCFGTIDAPDDQAAVFSMAARQTIDVLHSPEFARDLRDFVARHGVEGPHAAAWADVDPTGTVEALKAHLPGQRVATYGGLRGWFLKTFFGNIAYDGSADGPILLNRAALPREAPSIANTFAHEIAHRAGLRHPHSSGALTIARCEPPYVIGSLVEKHAAGPTWQPGSDDCHLFGTVP
ncbi:hypothetical protein [Pelagerythrobacter rhizovicinus]|uniref:Matrixin family metalloprotease n=1 Tax=Pelagerythrobacter rhizovicinus TaxID=2268576 RepID=A0A4Q2KMH9_9SPHN|nr:hypothetical protein [Pelagerythrobacter rhizovicinus]RXZ66554.1 hypothetical protein ETX26_07730 [Pelagerythrobacter rhizovicinus]